MAGSVNKVILVGNLGADPDFKKRYWNKVAKTNSATDCWLWTGALDTYGYGTISRGGRKNKRDYKAHRVAYELHHGRPPAPGLGVCHRCDNRACVNPSHLYEGTQKQNIADTVRRGRLNPASQLNLRPGARGHRGAGPMSNLEMRQCQDR